MRVRAPIEYVAQTRIIHISDTYPETYQEQSGTRCDHFRGMIELAVESDVAAVVYSGSLFGESRPALPTRCADALDTLGEHDIPLYVVARNHDRRTDDQWRENVRRRKQVARLGREPKVVGDTALYGLDMVRADHWKTTDFTLEEPPDGVARAILCVGELLELPAENVTIDSLVEDILDRVSVDLDAAVLGGWHQPESTRLGGTDIWWAGAMESGTDGAAAVAAQLLEVDDGNLTRQRLELQTRQSETPARKSSRDGSVARVPDTSEPDDHTEAVTQTEGVVEDGGAWTDDQAQIAADASVTAVDTDRDHVDRAAGERSRQTLPTAQNAVETVALRSLRQRSGQETVSTARNATVDRTRDDPEQNQESRENMTGQRAELVEVRDRFDSELSELGTVIDDIQALVDALEEDIAAAVRKRDTAVETFLPDDQVPESVSTETRGAIASHLDALTEKRDVRSETVARKNDRLKVQIKRAKDARDDIAETAAVVDRLAERTDEAESRVEDARLELEAARSQFADDLAELAERFEPFDMDLSQDTLGRVIEERVPERKTEMRGSVERIRERVTELSARKARLAKDRDRLQSIEGGGTCPTCDQDVGPDRSETELKAIQEELHAIDRRLGAAKQERDEMIAGIEELDDLRDRAIRLRSSHSETVAQAVGRVEDCQENFEDLQADLEEERTELAEAREERDEADAAITRLESEIDSLMTEIDRLHAKSDEGEACLEAFEVVDELRGQLEERVEELWELQMEYEQKETERASLDAEIEELENE